MAEALRLREDAGDVEAELRRSRQMLAEAQKLARIGSWEWDVAAGVVTWSDELFRIYGYEPGAITPDYETFLSHVHPDDRASVDERNRRCFAEHQPFEDVKRVRRADGSEFLMRTQGEVIVDDSGNVLRMVGICEDVTDRVRAEQAQALLASIVRSSADAIYTLTRDGIVTSWNPAAERMFGYREAEALGRDAARLVPADEAEADERLMARVLAGEQPDAVETLRRRRDGAHVAVSLAMSPVIDLAGSVAGVSVIARDVTERRRFERRLRYLADRDPLTGLFNRRRFEEDLRLAANHAARYGSGGAVIVLDLDNFKHTNDTLGHAGGDEVIRSIARLLRARLRSTDVVARLGGDEFALLLPHAGLAEARTVGRQLVTAVRRHGVVVGGHRVRVTTSVGVTIVGSGLQDAGELLACADAALYAAKDAGRDRVVVYGADDGRRVRAGAATSWERRIEAALAHDGFELHLQPIVDLDADAVTRYEALLRMRGDEGLTPPGAFLPVAERLGLIHDIDRWVVTEAIALMGRHPSLELEVNLSGRSLDDDDLPALIEAALGEQRVDASRLVLEITETATIANMDDARRFAEALTDLGCRFAIDDFGAGFGSFSYLKHLPATYLKIDGDFVRSPRSRTDELVIEAIVGMARGLGKATIAEFVSDDETVAMLRHTGVDYAQGYHVGRPFPAAALS